MDSNNYATLKMDAISFDDLTKLNKAMNNKSCQISYDDVTELANAITTNNLISNAITTNNLISNTIATSTPTYTYEDVTLAANAQQVCTSYTYPMASYKETINKKDLSRFMRDISLVLLDAANGKDLTQVLETMSTYFAAYADALENDTKYEENETE